MFGWNKWCRCLMTSSNKILTHQTSQKSDEDISDEFDVGHDGQRSRSLHDLAVFFSFITIEHWEVSKYQNSFLVIVQKHLFIYIRTDNQESLTDTLFSKCMT